MKKAATVEQEKKEMDELTKLFPDIEQIRAMKMVESAHIMREDPQGTNNAFLKVRLVPGIEHVSGTVYPQMELAIFPKESDYSRSSGFRSVDLQYHDELPSPLRFFTQNLDRDWYFSYPCIGDYSDDYWEAIKQGNYRESVARLLECLQSILLSGEDEYDDD